MKKLLLFVLCFFLTGCGKSAPETTVTVAPPPETAIAAPPLPEPTLPTETQPADPIQELLESLSLDQRVGQLFLARCQDATALEDITRYNLGGFVLFGADFENQTKQSMAEKLSCYQEQSPIPLLISVDEEGGTVNRISRLPAFRAKPFSSPRSLYQNGGIDAVLTEAEEKCQLFQSLGINVNLGPVCDITTDPNAFMYRRSLGLDPNATALVVDATVRLQNAYHIGSILKHFPGYGNNADTHTGIAADSRSLQQLESNDLIPFQSAFEAGAGGVMVSHTIVTALDETMPASLSPAVHTYIRQQMGFDGIIVTDDLAMQAITNQYGAGEAAVLAVLAGNDLLCSTEYAVQYEAVLAAVLDGRIDFDTLSNAAYRVLKWKHQLGLL